MARLPVAAKFAFTVSLLIAGTVGSVCAQSARTPMIDTSGAAQLVSFSGQVSVLHDSTPWALNVGDYVHPLQTIVTGSNGSATFKVADGSIFEVFPSSKVVFRANRGNWQDLLELWLGKIRIQIEHPGGVPNNNKVRTPTAVISVRGTIFDVDYDSENEITTVLDEEGSVEVARALRQDDKKILNAGDVIHVSKNESLARSFDKSGMWQKVFHSAMDAITQEGINRRNSAPTGAGQIPGPTAPSPGTNSGDKNNSPPSAAPPPPPPAPPAP